MRPTRITITTKINASHKSIFQQSGLHNPSPQSCSYSDCLVISSRKQHPKISSIRSLLSPNWGHPNDPDPTLSILTLADLPVFWENYTAAINCSITLQSSYRPKPIEQSLQLLSYLCLPHYWVCLITIYACGLRVSEGGKLQVTQVDGARMLLHVRQGKGVKDRCVPLSKHALERLSQHWTTHRHPVWLFPGRATFNNV